jgi:hypothetical protein
VEGCGRVFGYKHILQRHQARGHSDEDEQQADADEESSEVERPRPKKRKSRRDPSPGTIDEITGVAYAERAAGRRVQLKCPHPAMEGFELGVPVERTSLWGDEAPCEYVFGRAYDLRRHLGAVHDIILDKDIVDLWARNRRLRV